MPPRRDAPPGGNTPPTNGAPPGGEARPVPPSHSATSDDPGDSSYLKVDMTELGDQLGVRAEELVAALRAHEGAVEYGQHGGGGGERVLWCAIRAVEEAFPGWQVAVYSGDGIGPEELCNSAAAKFGVSLKKPIKVVELHQRSLVEASAYPHFTLVGQALGSIALAWEALCQLRPEVFVDTAGYAFTYPLALAAGARVACYVHYPTISTDMLHRVASRQAMYNNDPTVASSALRSAIKLGYYHAFALLYGVVGACPSAVMVNSSWTEGHIVRLWWRLSPPVRLFPPCDTAKLQELPLEGRDREGSPLVLVSVAQFRPEKAHRLQLDAFRGAMHAAAFGACKRPHAVLGAKLLLIGSCRHEEDAQRLAGLREYAAELGLSDNVEFHINVSYTELVRLLGSAVGGLHTMVDEHFGISVVEYMAAGVIPIAHNSGGPRADIVQPYNRDDSTVVSTGFLATTAQEYCEAIIKVMDMEVSQRAAMAEAGRQACARFSEEEFTRGFIAAMRPLIAK
mmetsp:Transcript_26322/g.66155  ORF Transcript_26322/g.66155 Transcript_26322/m.66155 type:complete len:510 (+) Transcript_26322:170-1699(+)